MFPPNASPGGSQLLQVESKWEASGGQLLTGNAFSLVVRTFSICTHILTIIQTDVMHTCNMRRTYIARNKTQASTPRKRWALENSTVRAAPRGETPARRMPDAILLLLYGCCLYIVCVCYCIVYIIVDSAYSFLYVYIYIYIYIGYLFYIYSYIFSPRRRPCPAAARAGRRSRAAPEGICQRVWCMLLLEFDRGSLRWMLMEFGCFSWIIMGFPCFRSAPAAPAAARTGARRRGRLEYYHYYNYHYYYYWY